MKITLYKKQILMTMICLLSLASVYLIALPIISIHQGVTADVNANGFLSEIAKTILSKDVYITVIIVSFLLLAQIILSFIFIKKYKTPKAFGYLSFLAGGLSLHVWYLLFLYIAKLIPQKYKISPTSHVVKIVSGTATGLLVITGPIVMLVAGSNDSVYKLERAELSSNANQMNVIEIYTDAIDRKYSKEIVAKNPDLKDFTLYHNYLTSGQFTHFSKPTLDGGMENNPFELTYKNHLGNNAEYKKFVYNQEFGKDIMTNNTIDTSYFNSKYIANYINVSNTDSYVQATSGSKAQSQDKFPGIKGMNYLTAKKLEAGNWGTTQLAPEVVVQKQVFKNADISDKSSRKGGYLYFHDLIVHGPYYTDPNGNFSTDIKSTEEVYQGYNNYVSRIISSLKAKGIYDNSLVLIYGDHGNHGNPFWNTKNIDSLEYSSKPLSAMFVKFPFQTHQEIKINSDNVIYGPWLKQKLNEYVVQYNHKKGNPYPASSSEQENNVAHKFLDIDKRFEYDTKRNYPIFITNHSGTFVHFVMDKKEKLLTHSKDPKFRKSNVGVYDKLDNKFFSNSRVNRAMLLDEYSFSSYKGGV